MSHHPPISAFYVSNRKDGFCLSGSILAKSKFYGEFFLVLNCAFPKCFLVSFCHFGKEFMSFRHHLYSWLLFNPCTFYLTSPIHGKHHLRTMQYGLHLSLSIWPSSHAWKASLTDDAAGPLSLSCMLVSFLFTPSVVECCCSLPEGTDLSLWVWVSKESSWALGHSIMVFNLRPDNILLKMFVSTGKECRKMCR